MGPFPTDHIFFRAQAAGGIRLIPGTYRILDDKHHSDHQGLVILVEVGESVENQPATEMER